MNFLVIYDRDVLNNERILECLVNFKGDVLNYKEILEYLVIYWAVLLIYHYLLFIFVRIDIVTYAENRMVENRLK